MSSSEVIIMKFKRDQSALGVQLSVVSSAVPGVSRQKSALSKIGFVQVSTSKYN